ncbi:MAG TPA: MFS transporter [Methylomirabilota bacterium]|jgi:MFS family permease|nr:MFS transporter [Methylomirabilota bacterium]
MTLRSHASQSLIATFVTLAFAYGVWYAYSVFLVALAEEFHWSRSLLAGAFALFALVHGLSSPPLGWLADRLGPRRVFVAGGTVLAVALVVDGAVTRPLHLYLGFGVLTSLGVTATALVPSVVLIRGWFPRRFGTALGIASAGIGVGIFAVVPLCQAMIDAVGWRWAFRVLAALIAAWMIPAALALVRDPPACTPRPLREPEEPTLATALAQGSFWLLATAQFCGNFVCQMLLVHQVAFLVDNGIPAMAAASVAGLVGLASVFAKVGSGWAADVLGRRQTFTTGMVVVLASVGLLGLVALSPQLTTVYVYGVLMGIGYAATVPIMPTVISDVFRGVRFGSIFGSLHLANAIGGAAGAWLAGTVFDATGGYTLSFAAAAIAAVLAIAGVWLAQPMRAPAREPLRTPVDQSAH